MPAIMPKLFDHLLKDMIPLQTRFLEEVTEIAEEAFRLMHEFALTSKQTTQKKGRKKKNNAEDTNTTISSRRVPRTTRNVTISKIEKESSITLNQEIRHPDCHNTPRTQTQSNDCDSETNSDMVPHSSTDGTREKQNRSINENSFMPRSVLGFRTKSRTSGRHKSICNKSKRSTRSSKRSKVMNEEKDAQVISGADAKKENCKKSIKTRAIAEIETEKTEELNGVVIEIEMAEEVLEDGNESLFSHTINLSPSFSRPNAESSAILSPKVNSCNVTFLVPRKPLAIYNSVAEPAEATFIVNKDKIIAETPIAYSKRTKPVVNSKYFDNTGYPLSSTRKEGELFDGISPFNNIHSTQSRIVHKSTFGMDEPHKSLKPPEIESDFTRMTRTKTRAMQKAAENENNLITFNDQQIKRKSSVKKVPSSTGKENVLLVTKLPNSASRFTPASSNRIKPPLSAKIVKPTQKKVMSHATVVTSVNDEEIPIKLKETELMEEKAKIKKIMELNKIRDDLKRKNIEKLNKAWKYREKLEVGKQEQKLPSEKEKEERRIQLLKEKKKREIEVKKLRRNRKLAENEEGRRKEEALQLANIKELKLKQSKLQNIKQHQLEEKQVQANKVEVKKVAQIVESQKSDKVKKIKFKYNLEKYKPRNDDDFGLHYEYSDVSDDEDNIKYSALKPLWVNEFKQNQQAVELMSLIPNELFSEFMIRGSMTPNVQVLFQMTPTRAFSRSSSAIWTSTPD